jgi:formiminoglutamase
MTDTDLSVYFQPLSGEAAVAGEGDRYSFGSCVSRYTEASAFPAWEDCQVVLIGVPEERGSAGNTGCAGAPDAIRAYLYKLKQADASYRVADLGNLVPGETLADTYAAVSSIVMELMKASVLPVILGGSQDLTYAQYVAYQRMEETVNIVAVDARFDLGRTEDKIHSRSYLGKIILHEPNFLFNFSNIGYQTYFVGTDSVQLMEKLYFDTYRLGQIRRDLEETEPIIRNADIFSFDVSAIRQSEAPGNAWASPNGFFGDEACQIARYAGMSDKLTSAGFYEVNPALDNGQTAHLVAQMVWYFIEGFYNRKKDMPVSNKSGFIKYNVAVSKAGHDLIFYKSKKSDRWWMDVPYPNDKARYHRHHLVPCSYRDYESACRDEMPERWWQAFQKLS